MLSLALPPSRSFLTTSAVVLAGMGAIVATSTDALATIPAYALVGQYTLPGGAWDVGPDGRIWGIVGNNIVRQDAVNGSSYATVGSVPAGTTASFGASFLRVSPDGSTLAIGDNNFSAAARVHFVTTSDLNTSNPASTRSVVLGNYAATWDGNQLYVSGSIPGGSPFVSRVSFTNVTGTPVATTLITGIGAGSGGIAVRGSTLYTGVGFATSGTPAIGEVRAFNLATVGSGITPFLSGSLIATILSAASIDIDPLGNLIVAGADFSNYPVVTGFARVVDATNPASTLTLAPLGSDRSYGVRFNAATQELLVTTGNTAFRYAIPTPATAASLVFGGLIASRRRR